MFESEWTQVGYLDFGMDAWMGIFELNNCSSGLGTALSDGEAGRERESVGLMSVDKMLILD